MNLFSFELITLEGQKFQEEVYQVTLPTKSGEISILSHHVPLITIITAGIIMIKRSPQAIGDQIEHVATSGGFVEIDGQRVRVLADSAERANDIDELKAKEALSRAQHLRDTNKDQVALADATRLIEVNTARLKVAGLKRRKRRY